MKHNQVLIGRPFDRTFTYSFDKKLEPGTVVTVNFAGGNTYGMVTDDQESTDVDPNKIKQIQEVMPLVLNVDDVKFINTVGNYNLAFKGMIFKQVVPRGVLDKYQEHDPVKYSFNLHKLSTEQSHVYDEITNHGDGFGVHLIDGETGSGKTEVYLKLASDLIEKGHQVLILLPEIVLTNQLLQRFTERLGVKPTEWHSRLGAKARRENFQQIMTGKTQFIIGARSALFLPYHNLKMIVVDEEHDRSYKQEEGAIYHARDMAIIRAKSIDAKVLLVSATPSLESYHNAKIGKYQYYTLPNRFGAATLPRVELLDLNLHKLAKNSLLSAPLVERIRGVLKQERQALLFLNKRGFAPIIHCNECAHKESCKNCNSLLVYHQRRNSLMCHHCGYKRKYNNKCSECESDDINMFGLGIEKLEEEAKRLFPTARIAVLTADVMQNPKKIQSVLNDIVEGNVDLILGTQIIAKGLNFPKLKLVAVIDAESNIMGYDPRAFEQTYQLLHQVAGRAGRIDDQGIVSIQTYEPNHPLFQCIKTFDKSAFYEYEYNARKLSNTPPFSRMITITAIDRSELRCVETLEAFKSFLPENDELEVMGPAPTPMYYLKGSYRYRLILKVGKTLNIQKNLSQIVKTIENSDYKNARLVVDVDSYLFR